ncbi:MAG: hypothetical protein HYX92_11985 [Chloroflexi bacterium]|nr:hypothetical protein [Chloroflexota bacterium]
MSLDTGIEILDPHAEEEVEGTRLALRPARLDSKVIGFLDNTKANANVLLARLEEILASRHKFAKIIRQAPSFERTVGTPTPELDALAAECQVVVNGVGD